MAAREASRGLLRPSSPKFRFADLESDPAPVVEKHRQLGVTMSHHIAAVLTFDAGEGATPLKERLLAFFRHHYSPESAAVAVPGQGFLVLADPRCYARLGRTASLALAGGPFLRQIAPVPDVLQSCARACEEDPRRLIGSLNGIFGGFLLDEGGGTARVFVDRLGAQPLYTARVGRIAFFSTSLVSLAHVTRSPFDAAGVTQFIGVRALLGDRTIFSAVRRFPPATILTLSRDGDRQEAYWDPRKAVEARALTREALAEATALFNQAVARRIPADRVAGVGITGGLDTRTILSSLVRAGVDVQGFSIVGAKPSSESRLMCSVAAASKISHRFFTVDWNALGPMEMNLAKTARDLEGEVPALPFLHLIPALTEQSRRSSVMFSGSGGEALRGEHYRVGYRRSAIESNLADHLLGKLYYGRGYLRFLNPELTPRPMEVLRTSIAEELSRCDCGNAWATLDIYQLRNDVRRRASSGLWIMNRVMRTAAPFLDNDFLDFALKFSSYDNNTSPFQDFIIGANYPSLAKVPRRIDFEGSLAIQMPKRASKLLLSWNALLRLPTYVALHRLSIHADPFGYRKLLRERQADVDALFAPATLKTEFLYRPGRMRALFREEAENGYRRYYSVGDLMTLELLARSAGL